MSTASTGRPLRISSSCISWSSFDGSWRTSSSQTTPASVGRSQQVPLDQPPVAGPGRLARPGEAVAGQVHEVERRQPVDVEQRGLARRAADPGEPRPPHQRVEQARLADVRPADEGDLGKRRVERDQRVGERSDEFDGQRRREAIGRSGDRGSSGRRGIGPIRRTMRSPDRAPR